ncbi:hypothetical protein [Paenibacillus sp. IHBB 3054]|uniref:hypothetical protein n=1 Tax=Paenibacillus sp. IHBB 3054 TaxID=3425689 RepID=UPI003F66567C
MGEARRIKQITTAALRSAEYAKRCNIDQAHAARRLAALDKADKQFHKAERCPKCGKYELVVDSTDYEYTNNEEWIWCSECGFTHDISKKYEPLLNWAQFDTVAAEADMFRADGFPDDWIEDSWNQTIALEKWIQEVEEAQ